VTAPELGEFYPDGTEPCIGHTDLYYATPGQTGWKQAVATAQRLCAGCHRQHECLWKARWRGEHFGVWGGVQFHINPKPRHLPLLRQTHPPPRHPPPTRPSHRQLTPSHAHRP
jgi:hypothetical protein